MSDSCLGLVDFDLGRLSDEMLGALVEASHGGRDPDSTIALAIRNALVEEQGLRVTGGRRAHARTFNLPPLDQREILEGLEGLRVNMEDFLKLANRLRQHFHEGTVEMMAKLLDLQEGFLFCNSLALALKSQADAICAAQARAN